RWAAADADRFHKYAEELLALAPDVILASATPSVQALQQATRTVPIVFANVADPVGMGFVESLARPGGNITGFTPNEFGFSAKWLGPFSAVKRVNAANNDICILVDNYVVAIVLEN